MKKIKINFIGFWSNFEKESNLFTNILREKYDVEISETPDFVFVSPLGEPYEYLKYDCVRILFAGEPLTPDFNVFDYAIAFDKMSCIDSFGNDRYYRYPLCLYNIERLKKCCYGLSRAEAESVLEKKKYFCNFIYGHRSSEGQREKMLEVFQSYKRVESAGSFMNNMPDNQVVPYSEKKMDFLKLCKFTISCESVSHAGFITEKIINPFYSDSVPIYYGNPLAASEFNSKAIINCHEYGSFEEALEKVIEIDNNDELYINMLMQPKFISADYLDNLYNGLKEFLWRICSLEVNQAYRRCRYYISKEHETHLKEYSKFRKTIWFRAYKFFSHGR